MDLCEFSEIQCGLLYEYRVTARGDFGHDINFFFQFFFPHLRLLESYLMVNKSSTRVIMYFIFTNRIVPISFGRLEINRTVAEFF